MATSREAIYSALWALVAQDPRVQGVFVTASRYARLFEQVDATEMPALFLVQKGETWFRTGKGIPGKRTLMSHFLCYANTANPTEDLPATAINTLLDVLDDVLEHPGNPGNVQTLGGLVEHVYLEGEVLIAEGYFQTKSISVVPITILIP